MNIPSTVLELSRFKLPSPTPPAAAAGEKKGSKLAGAAGSLSGAIIDSVGLTGTTLLETIPFQIKAQGDLWHSDRSLGNRLLWSAGLVGINAAALCLSPLAGLAVGGIYGYQAGADQGFKASLGATTGLLQQANTFISDTCRVSSRHQGQPAPAPSAETVQVRYLTQDPAVMAPIEGDFPKNMFGDQMANPRIAMDDVPGMLAKPGSGQPHPPAQPDASGNYLFQPGTVEFEQAQSFISANLPLNMYQKALGHEIPWAFEGPLKVHPHAGDGFNAFYARQLHAVNYFDGQDTVTGKTIHGSESLEVSSHEVGHAVLDAMKPGLMAWWGGLEAPAFHESFGDITAILTTLQEPTVIDKVVAETGGNLHQPNIVARLGEEFSQGINDTMLHGSKPKDWVMRDANNNFKYQDPAGLPAKPADIDDMFREPHSFSRIFTGAFWDVLSGVNDQFKAQGSDPKTALIQARDAMTQLTARTLELIPNRMKHLSQASQAMLEADQRYCGGKFHDVIQKAMSERNLLPAEAPAPALPKLTFAPSSNPDQWLKENAQDLPGRDTNWKSQAVTHNELGETFVRFGDVKEVALDQRTVTDMGASLTLGFDRDGKLFHMQHEPVDQEAIGLARQEVQTWRELGAIQSGRPGAHGMLPEHATNSSQPVVGYTVPIHSMTGTAREKLVRVPVAYN